jgi:long-chain acyl-CoA synthetase
MTDVAVESHIAIEDAAGRPKNAYGALLLSARRRAHEPAIIYRDEILSYERLLALVDNAAGQLLVQGIRRGAVFSAYCRNRPELMFCYYAAARNGSVFVPLNPNLTPSEVAYAFAHSGARLLLCDEDAADISGKSVPAEKLLPIGRLRDVSPMASQAPPADTRLHDDFLIIYTSGTTGVPKAIVLDHAAQTRAPRALATMWNITETDTTLVALPLGYLYGLSTAAAVGLQTGGKVVILPRFHPGEVLEALVAHGATVFHGVPTMFSMMLKYCEQRDLKFDLSGTRELICAGAPLPLEMRKRFGERFGKELQNYYAMTESTPVFGKFSNDPLPIPEGAVGKAAPELEVKIVRSDGTECATGEQGEILVRGAATMSRYLNAPEQSAAAFAGNLFRSGDLGCRDEKGNFYITGRIKDIIIRGGANISPVEVEEVLLRHPTVQDVAVVGAPNRIFGEVPVAFVVVRPGLETTPDELIEHAEHNLSDFKVPRTIHFETALPVGKTGKVDKASLKRRVALQED